MFVQKRSKDIPNMKPTVRFLLIITYFLFYNHLFPYENPGYLSLFLFHFSFPSSWLTKFLITLITRLWNSHYNHVLHFSPFITGLEILCQLWCHRLQYPNHKQPSVPSKIWQLWQSECYQYHNIFTREQPKHWWHSPAEHPRCGNSAFQYWMW